MPPFAGAHGWAERQRQTKMKTGDKVVCVDASPCPTCGRSSGLINNLVYVVSRIADDCPAIAVLGVTAGCGTGFFRAERFRLLDEMKAFSKRERVAALPNGPAQRPPI